MTKIKEIQESVKFGDIDSVKIDYAKKLVEAGLAKPTLEDLNQKDIEDFIKSRSIKEYEYNDDLEGYIFELEDGRKIQTQHTEDPFVKGFYQIDTINNYGLDLKDEEFSLFQEYLVNNQEIQRKGKDVSDRADLDQQNDAWNSNSIEFKEVYHEVHSREYITSNNHTDYVREEGDYVFQAERNGKKVDVTLQTGHSILMGDYRLPDPKYEVYEVKIDGDEVNLDDIEKSDPVLYVAIQDLSSNCNYDTTPESYNYDLTGNEEHNYGEVIENLSYDEMREKLSEGGFVATVAEEKKPEVQRASNDMDSDWDMDR